MAGAFLLDDLATMFDENEFATEATIGANTVPVIFDNAYASVLDGLVESTGPACTGPTSALASAVQGTAITIDSTAYLVTHNQPDGTGITTLLLERAA